MSSTVVVRDFWLRLAKDVEQVVRDLESWLSGEHNWYFETVPTRQFQDLLHILKQEAQRLVAGKVYVVIVLMGGTGVGKSTLLNALAGQPIAKTGVLRPTTRQVLTYIHKQLASVNLPSQLLEQPIWHEHHALHNKVIVDAPDLDSRETENYRRLRRILPYADIIVYVGSTEKYHDLVGWELFREYSRQKAFAFVLNRWDECIEREQTGERPDLDWIRDLQREGYERPLLFRTSARYWTTAAHSTSDGPPAGDQFQELRQWLEAELGEKELVAIRQRNLEELIRQCAEHLEQLISNLKSVDFEALTKNWENLLCTAVQQFAERCESFLYQQQKRLDDYLREETTRRISGWLSALVKWWRGWKGPQLTASLDSAIPTHLNTRLADLVNDLLQSLGDTYLRYFGEDLTNQLLEQAANQGLPIILLEQPLREIAQTDWLRFWKEQVSQALAHSQQGFWQRRGWRGWLHAAVNWMPGRLSWIAGFLGLSLLLYRMFFATVPYSPGLGDVLYFLVPWFLVEALSYFLAYRLSPHNWQELVSAMNQQMQQQALSTLCQIYGAELSRIQIERDKELAILEQIQGQVTNILRSLEQRREEIAAVKRLYAQQLQIT